MSEVSKGAANTAAPIEQHDAPLPIEPGEVMRREHYERMVREAQQQ